MVQSSSAALALAPRQFCYSWQPHVYQGGQPDCLVMSGGPLQDVLRFGETTLAAQTQLHYSDVCVKTSCLNFSSLWTKWPATYGFTSIGSLRWWRHHRFHDWCVESLAQTIDNLVYATTAWTPFDFWWEPDENRLPCFISGKSTNDIDGSK